MERRKWSDVGMSLFFLLFYSAIFDGSLCNWTDRITAFYIRLTQNVEFFFRFNQEQVINKQFQFIYLFLFKHTG